MTSTVCDSAGDECRYRDKITNLEWSEVDGTTRAWGAAVKYCEDLVLDGQSDWRLPTQKELMGAYEHGIRSAANSSWISDANMSGNTLSGDHFWTSTISSSYGYYLWSGFLGFGGTYYWGNTVDRPWKVVCVRQAS